MAVYVDNFNASYGRMMMSHMIADSHEELIAMVQRIGVDPKWIQDAGTSREHFDVCKAKRLEAIKAGAIAVSIRQLATLLHARKPAPRG